MMIEQWETYEFQRDTQPVAPALRVCRETDDEKREDRLQILSAAISNLPARIHVNEKRGYYSVQDNTLMAVWTDDLPEGGGAGLVFELSMLFDPEDREHFLNTYNRALRGCPCGMGLGLKSGFIPRGGIWHEQSIPVSINVLCGAGSSGKIYELRIEPINLAGSA